MNKSIMRFFSLLFLKTRLIRIKKIENANEAMFYFMIYMPGHVVALNKEVIEITRVMSGAYPKKNGKIPKVKKEIIEEVINILAQKDIEASLIW